MVQKRKSGERDSVSAGSAEPLSKKSPGSGLNKDYVVYKNLDLNKDSKNASGVSDQPSKNVASNKRPDTNKIPVAIDKPSTSRIPGKKKLNKKTASKRNGQGNSSANRLTMLKSPQIGFLADESNSKNESEIEDEDALEDYMADSDVESNSGGDTEDDIEKYLTKMSGGIRNSLETTCPLTFYMLHGIAFYVFKNLIRMCVPIMCRRWKIYEDCFLKICTKLDSSPPIIVFNPPTFLRLDTRNPSISSKTCLDLYSRSKKYGLDRKDLINEVIIFLLNISSGRNSDSIENSIKSFFILWETVPFPYVRIQELYNTLDARTSNCSSDFNKVLEKGLETYKTTFKNLSLGDIEPRKLEHLCRCELRCILWHNRSRSKIEPKINFNSLSSKTIPKSTLNYIKVVEDESPANPSASCSSNSSTSSSADSTDSSSADSTDSSSSESFEELSLNELEKLALWYIDHLT